VASAEEYSCLAFFANGSALDRSLPQVLEAQQHDEYPFELTTEMDLIAAEPFQLVCVERLAECLLADQGPRFILLSCNTEAMALHLAEIFLAVTPGRHALVLLDQAGWHVSKKLAVPDTINTLAVAAEFTRVQPGLKYLSDRNIRLRVARLVVHVMRRVRVVSTGRRRASNWGPAMQQESSVFIGLDTSKMKIFVDFAEEGRQGEVRFFGDIEAA
jgi:hypothetical protein